MEHLCLVDFRGHVGAIYIYSRRQQSISRSSNNGEPCLSLSSTLGGRPSNLHVDVLQHVKEHSHLLIFNSTIYYYDPNWHVFFLYEPSGFTKPNRA